MSKVQLHPDYQPLNGATGRFDRAIPVYDDGSGDLYAFYQACGNSSFIAAIVRADSWESAIEICEDEFYPEAPSWEEMLKEHECDSIEDLVADHGWQESYGHRPSGPSTSEHTTNEHDHGIYSKDVNGCDQLHTLTEEMLEAHEITLDAVLDWEGVASACMDLEWTDANGIYIPHLFCLNLPDEQREKQDENVRECIDNLKPESSVHEYEHYWEDWDTVLQNFEFNGHRLHQNGDLWSYDSEEVEKLSTYYGVTDDDVATYLFGG